MTDQITTEVIRHALLAAAEEMARNLSRTSYNTVVYEIHDYGIGIHDTNGDVVADSPGIAVFTRGNDAGIKNSIEFLGRDAMEPGDVFIINYPYWSSAHTLDPLVFAPIHFQDELIGFASVRVHVQDLNQKDPGYVLDSVHASQEGLVFPASKLLRRGVMNDDVLNIIRFNSRSPKKTIGDILAQVSACHAGAKRTTEIAEKYGPDTLAEAMKAINDHGEKLARLALEKLPKGTWTASDYVDDDGLNKDRLIKLQATVTIDDEGMTVDWTGSAEDVEGPINLPVGQTQAVSSLIFKAITTPDTPVVAGNFAPLKVITKPGSVMHAVPPMPTFTLWTGLLAGEVVLKALAVGMPDLVPACSGGDVCSMMGLGYNPRTGEYWNEATNEAVGFGGMLGSDGEDGIMHLSEPGCRNNPVEVLETKSSMLIDSYGYRPDSGGPGEFRGGVGVSRVYRFTRDTTAICLVYKTKTSPWPLEGGRPGKPNVIVLNPGTDHEKHQGGSYNHMKEDEVLVNATGGGGGYGDPFKRDPKKVAYDVRNGFVSPASAKESYGVVVNDDFSVDEQGTVSLRGH